MNEMPCFHLRPHHTCYLGRNTLLDCTGCSGYDAEPAPALGQWVAWHEIRNGIATSSDPALTLAGVSGDCE